MQFKQGNILVSLDDIKISENQDMVNNLYAIHLNEEVHDLSNHFCKYYYATNLETQEKYFAIVFNKSFVVPLKVIDFLSQHEIPGLNSIIDSSIVQISSTSSQQLVLIIDSYDYTQTLYSYIEKNGAVSSVFIEKMVVELNPLIEKLSAAGIYGYNISPDNIIMNGDEFLCLKEFITSYPYFYVYNRYIAPELAECIKAGKRPSSSKSDIYGLGVTLYHAYTGKMDMFDDLSIEEYNENRFEYTTYKYLLNKIKLPERLRNFFRFTMHDDLLVRWNSQNINFWLEGKVGKVLHDSIEDNKYTIGFNNRNYSNMKALAYGLFRSWDAAGQFIKDSKLSKWASRQKITNDMLDGIKNILESSGGDNSLGYYNSVGTNKKIAQLLSVIDPTGPIRQENLAFSAESIPELVNYLYQTKRNVLLEQVVKIIKDKAWEQYNNLEAAGALDKNNAEIFTDAGSYFDLKSYYKGSERLIYTLNPTMPCMSSLLSGQYVTNIEDLLIALEVCAQDSSKHFAIDKHIIAFISAKLELTEPVANVILQNFPQFSEHQTIRALSVLHFLQQHMPEIKLPHVAGSITKDLINLFNDYLHNAQFKEEITVKLSELETEGDLSMIIELLSDQQPFINDYNGYYEACKKIKNIEARIHSLSDQQGLYNGALLWGQKMTVLASYILCFIVTLSLIM